MFNDADFQLAFAPVKSEPQLVLIPINDEYGVLAVAKTYGLGQASCIAFAPATKLDKPFDDFRPQFLRKTVTNDFSLRTGAWKPVSLTDGNAVALRNAAVSVLESVENMNPEDIRTIDMDRPTNVSSAPDIATAAYRADEQTPYEKALMHLMGVEDSSSLQHAAGDDTAA